MIIDFHTHIFPPRIKENRSQYLQLDPCFAELYTSPKAKIATAEELVDSMDRAGVDISVVLNIGWASQELCALTNDYILEAISRYPHRLIGFCTIPPKAGKMALAEIERCARQGAKGIGETRADIQGFDLGDRELLSPLVKVAQEYDLLWLTHASEPVGHRYPGKGTITPDKLFSFISLFPGLRIICAHWGGGLPFYALMPEVASALTHTFFDTAASFFLYRPQIFEYVVKLVGVERILFGSDNPLESPARPIKEINNLDLSAEVKARILGGNAQALLATAGIVHPTIVDRKGRQNGTGPLFYRY